MSKGEIKEEIKGDIKDQWANFTRKGIDTRCYSVAVETNFARVEKPNQDEKKNFPGDLVEPGPGDYNLG